MAQQADTAPERAAYYERIADKNLAPLWEVLSGLVTDEPQTRVVPAIWRYDEIRGDNLESGGLISAKEAVRRVLILENPALKGESKITNTLYAGLQLILPGEVAPSHRHTQSALRFVVEGQGAYTAVEGERTTMNEGDFVITPNWTWHDHGNDSNEPMVWLDGLDVPIVSFFEASFAEDLERDAQDLSRPEGDALARYGSGLLPVGYEKSTPTSPVFNYPYARTREALEQMRGGQEWDACHGLKMRYVNPLTGDYAMPTIATFMQLLPKDFDGAAYRSTDGMVFSVVEGHGTVHVDAESMSFGPRDTFVVPSWRRYRLSTDEDVVVFSFSDRPAQQKLGLWREDRGNA